MKHFFVAFVMLVSLILSVFSFGVADASFTSRLTKKLTPTKPVWGKVLMTPTPGIVCAGLGQTMVLNSQLAGLKTAVDGAVNSTNGIERTSAVLGGIYNMLPTYASDPTKRPIIGGYVLGLNNAIPNFSLCKIGTVPIPVLKTTSTFGVSGATKMMTPKWSDLKTVTPDLIKSAGTTEITNIVDGMPVTTIIKN